MATECKKSAENSSLTTTDVCPESIQASSFYRRLWPPVEPKPPEPRTVSSNSCGKGELVVVQKDNHNDAHLNLHDLWRKNALQNELRDTFTFLNWSVEDSRKHTFIKDKSKHVPSKSSSDRLNKSM